jgi:hypothetical protein
VAVEIGADIDDNDFVVHVDAAFAHGARHVRRRQDLFLVGQIEMEGEAPGSRPGFPVCPTVRISK